MKIRIIVLGVASGLVFFQVFGYVLFSKRFFFDFITIDIKSELPQAPLNKINVLYTECLGDTSLSKVRDMNFNHDSQEVFKKSLYKEFKNINFVMNDSIFESSRKEPYALNYCLFSQKEYLFCQNTYETIYVYAPDESYAHIYERRMLWVLFFWWEFGIRDLGQS